KLAPRINAPGRLGAAEPSLALLLSDGATAQAKAQALEEANLERRAIQERVMKEALERLGAAPEPDAGQSLSGMRVSAQTGEWDGPAIVIAGEGWPTGVVGIVASKLVDKFRRPAFVIGIDPVTGVGRGSARTCGGVNLYAALREAAGSLSDDGVAGLGRYGGHAAAAGFTIQRDAIAPFAEALSASCGKLAAGSGPTPVGREVDAEVRLAEVDERLAAELAGLGPFGQENPAPLLLTRNARVSSVRRVGNDRHLKLTIEDDRGTIRGAIGFGLGSREVEVGAIVDMAFLPTVSTYQGRRSAEMEIADFAPSGS
ncbi:MAG: hypothetical protein KIT31_39390, partial [Deltaproteobacteria bacterium]|nr:hypothetical protein [Deltaproteobacteria bacterium]